MIRVSQTYITNQMIHDLQSKASELSSVQNKLTTQKKIKMAHEDPKSIGAILHFQSKIQDFNRYQNTIKQGISQLSFIDVQLADLNKILQKIRDLSLQGANGTLTPADRRHLSLEVEQNLDQMIRIANKRFQNKSIFSGSQTDIDSYKVHLERQENGNNPVVKKVTYQGDERKHYLEVGQGQLMQSNLTGKTLFESNNKRIVSQEPGTSYIAMSKHTDKPYQEIRINSTTIRINDGDTLEDIVDKINQTPISVKASIDRSSATDYLMLETTQAHSMTLEDVSDGTVLQDLGILKKGMPHGIDNIASSAIVEGNNIFDHVVQLRKALTNNNMQHINQSLGNLDMAIDHINYQRSIVGNRQSQMERMDEMIRQQEVYLHDIYSKLSATDLTKAMMNLKQIELSYQVAMQTAARIFRLTLLDVLK